ncbi:hypothetical protein FHS43_002819 [Streptosporangium becharense]|uniref:Uncharacterized protein n=1 Tax=Streptosporangium becharense TaxID=1816182 RepID=A0A7W9ILQ3_9ACTN|nr:hypothetical protein [Streptosporangium becharense]MBB5822636.1 hypothetical protein [Streptosporangium becharense]
MLEKLILAGLVAVAPAAVPVTSPPAVTGAPCPPWSPCAAVNCGPGRICVPSPKQCITTPCPQYECVEPRPAARPLPPSRPLPHPWPLPRPWPLPAETGNVPLA